MYDEMIDELLGGGGTTGDGDNRLEYWKRASVSFGCTRFNTLLTVCVCMSIRNRAEARVHLQQARTY